MVPPRLLPHSSAFSLKPFGNQRWFLHRPSDAQPVKNSPLNVIRLDSITSYRCLSSQSAGGRGLTASQPSRVWRLTICATPGSAQHERLISIHRRPSAAPRRSLLVIRRGTGDRTLARQPAAAASSLRSLPPSRFVSWQRTICTKSRRCQCHRVPSCCSRKRSF